MAAVAFEPRETRLTDPANVVNTRICSREPREIYGDPAAPIILRLANGGAGPTGVLRALAEDYFARTRCEGRIAWYQDISCQGLRQLQAGVVDMALIYEREQAQAALDAGYAQGDVLIFHDHFVLAGPRDNPANICGTDAVAAAFAKIFAYAERSGTAQAFISRDDQSATNLREREMWSAAGHRPWQNGTWYRCHSHFPVDALRIADDVGAYILTDYGTWLSTREKLRNTKLVLSGDAKLLNPCHALIGISPGSRVTDWLAYLTGDDAQSLIGEYGRAQFGGPLFSCARQPELATTCDEK
jgi:ABC-type tungstate transport system permease subunit